MQLKRQLIKRCGFLFAHHVLCKAGKWPLYALERAALGKLIVNHFCTDFDQAYGRNREVTVRITQVTTY